MRRADNAHQEGLLGEDESISKPRMLFFQWDHSPNRELANYFLIHMNSHVKCLMEFFNVTVVNRDCDYNQMCDLHRPDIVLFESGYQSFVSRRPIIKNVQGNHDIPKVALHNADSWSDSRSGFLSDMNQWGIETFFSICTTAHEYMPCVKNQMFIWPNFIDGNVFNDHGCEKIVPVMISGQHHEAYPWRNRVFPLLGEMFPAIICPTFHNESELANRTISGEAYARALNSSLFSPTCGTIAGEVVRKHLEIPGAKACLITQSSGALKEAGFVHMENCVFTEPDDIVEVMDLLMKDRDRLRRITESGFHLVHSRHTAKHRSQIYQWFILNNRLTKDEKIIQRGPFGDLCIESVSAPGDIPLFVSRGDYTSALKRANENLWNGRLAEAARDFEQCLGRVRYLPEGRFGLALCRLHAGDPHAAADLLARLVEGTTVDYGAADPDPLEWACLIVSVLGQGRLDRASELCRWYPQLVHPELSHVKHSVALLAGGSDAQISGTLASGPGRPSIHAWPDRDAEARVAWLVGILDACGQTALAVRLRRDGASAVRLPPLQSEKAALREQAFKLCDALLGAVRLDRLRPNVPTTADFHYFRHVRLKAKLTLAESTIGPPLRKFRRWKRARREMARLRNRLRSPDARPDVP